MPRQRIHHSRMVYVFPGDFPQRLEGFKEESGLPWAELARRIGTYRHTVWRWTEGVVRPNVKHTMALLAMSHELGLGQQLTAWTVRDETLRETADLVVPPRCRGPRGKAAFRKGGGDRRDRNAERGGIHGCAGAAIVGVNCTSLAKSSQYITDI